MAADPQLARDVFLAVSDLPLPQRAAFLTEACGSDAELRREVERLLAGAAKPDSLLDAPDSARELAAMTQRFNFISRGNPTARKPLAPGTLIDNRFILEDVIGTGGMGTVYRARQSEPVQRIVALKLIRPGMDSQSVLARFDTERQALALMEHPHIARILDGGMTEDGQPFFVMEHCPGPSITEYCDRRKLPVTERLRLFVDVCHAVQHAHQKGIIHRDLKPGNVLVGEVDGRATPKVIDFGIAKATQRHPRDTSLTETGAVVGTPVYMSPEQADPSSPDIDTRTDVYALGVMLYELLTGSPPLEMSRFERGSLLEMLRIVREEDPPTPSARLSTADMLPNIAANRGTEPSPLTRLVRGELDWVVMKALEKDRSRRYDTPNGLARDIQRYLADEIVEARPPSRSYRLRKFARRHRIELVAAVLVSAAVLTGVVATSLAYFEALRQKGIALKALQAETEQSAKEREARTLTSTRLRQIEVTNAALFDMFAEIDIRAIRAGSEPLEAHLAKKLVAFGKTVDERAIDDPLALAKLRTRLAQTLMNLGEAPAAVELSRGAADILEREQGPAHRDTLAARDLLASAYRLGGQAELAVPIYEQALRLLAAVAAEEDDEVLKLKNNLGLALQSAGRWQEALPLLVDVVSRRTAKRGVDDPSTLSSMNNLALCYQAAGRTADAVGLFEKLIPRLHAVKGADHPDTLLSLHNLGLSHQADKNLPRARSLFEETLPRMKTRLGADHPDTLTCANNLAAVYRLTGNAALAVPLFEEILRTRTLKLGENHADTLVSMSNLAGTFWTLKQLDKSVPLYEQLLKRREAKFGRQHPSTQHTLANLGVNYKDAGRLMEAISLLEEARETSRTTGTLGFVKAQLLDAYAKAGETEKYRKLQGEMSGKPPEAGKTP